MSYLFDSGPQGLEGAYHFGGPGLGVLGSVIRATTGTGEHGAGYLYNDWDDSGDDAKEFQGLVLTPPSAGTFFANEDGSFSLVDAADGTYTFVYRLYVDGVDEGTATATIVIGAGLATITGESSITLGAVTSAAAGVVTPLPITGASAITLGAVTSTAEGVVIAVGILGQSSVTLGDVVSVAEGVLLPVITGSSSVQLGEVVSTAAGVVLNGIVGQSAVTLGDVLSVAAGTVSDTVPLTTPASRRLRISADHRRVTITRT